MRHVTKQSRYNGFHNCLLNNSYDLAPQASKLKLLQKQKQFPWGQQPLSSLQRHPGNPAQQFLSGAPATASRVQEGILGGASQGGAHRNQGKSKNSKWKAKKSVVSGSKIKKIRACTFFSENQQICAGGSLQEQSSSI